MGHYNHSLPLDATIMVSKNCPTIGEHPIIFVTQKVTCKKTPLIAALTSYHAYVDKIKKFTVLFLMFKQLVMQQLLTTNIV